MTTLNLLHKIDKKLAVLEAVTRTHTLEADKQFIEIKEDLRQVKVNLDRTRVRVAGMAGAVSILVSLGAKWLL